MTDDEATEDLAERPRPVTPELRAQVKALHGEGLGRNAIARELRIAAGTVTKIARQHKPPLQFDREQTALAVAARQLDLTNIRTTLARKFLAIADETLDRVHAPVVTGQFGGKDNVWNEHLLDEATIDMRKTIVQTASMAYRAGIELLQAEAVTGSPVARSMVVELRDALTRGLAATPEVDPTVTPDQKPEPESETT